MQKKNKQRKFKSKARNFILKAITFGMALLFACGISCLDSTYITLPLLAMAIGGAWLFAFFNANHWFLKAGER